MKLIVDTGPLVALLDPSDQSRISCRECLDSLESCDLVTSEAVLVEAAYLLDFSARAQATLLQLVAAGRPRVEPLDRADWLRAATLMTMQHPSSLQLRLADPATRGERAGLGVCSGDSGGPVFEDSGGRLTVVAVVSWSTGPNDAGCGGLTGVTPLGLVRGWISDTAAKLGSPLQ